MKTCTRCKTPKSVDLFPKRKASADGLQSWCKACYAENAATKYRSDKDERDRKSRNRKNQRARNQALVLEYLSTHPCVDCGTTDVRVLEFDHRDPSVKKFNIASMYMSLSWSNLLAEIEKCDVRCANHHRIKTAEQFGTWRSLLEIGM